MTRLLDGECLYRARVLVHWLRLGLVKMQTDGSETRPHLLAPVPGIRERFVAAASGVAGPALPAGPALAGMLQEGQLQQFEAYCEKLYTSPDANERAAAEAALEQLSSSSEYIPQCQFVLDHSKLAYAQLVAANALKKLLMQSWNHLPVQQRVDLG